MESAPIQRLEVTQNDTCGFQRAILGKVNQSKRNTLNIEDQREIFDSVHPCKFLEIRIQVSSKSSVSRL